MATSKQVSDPRLLGTWRSDRRKTFKHFVPRPAATPQGLRRFRALFGKLVVRWTATKYWTELDGFRDSASYELVASDAETVVVRCFDTLSKTYKLRQLHFEGEYYWLWAVNLREYFKRVK